MENLTERVKVHHARPVLSARTSNDNFRAARETMVAMLAVASTAS